MMSLVKRRECLSLNLDCRVCFLGLGPEGRVTMGWEGCVGRKVQRSWRWESTGRSLIPSEVSLRRIFGGCLHKFKGFDFEYVGI